MTALNFVVEENQICFAIDTLCIEDDDKQPLSYITKFVALPHIQTIVTGTGLAMLIVEWMSCARGNVIAKDIDHLNQYTPDHLRTISQKYTELSRISATIYHFGYSESRDRFVGYAYRSRNNWIPEERLDFIGYKPEVEYSFDSDIELPRSFIELMEYQREQDLKLPLDKRLGIGGDIHFVVMNRNGINVSRCHRFASYEADYDIMCQKLNKA